MQAGSRAAARALASRPRVQLPVCNGIAGICMDVRSISKPAAAVSRARPDVQQRRPRTAVAAACGPPSQHQPCWPHRAAGPRPTAARRRVAARAGAQAGAAVQPDYVLSLPRGGAPIAVFGVEHLERQPHIGEWVLDNRPSAVVVETACHPGHGAWPGNLFSCSDQVVGTGQGFFQRLFCQVAASMQEQGAAARAPGGTWEQAAANLNGEQLAYVAALATGAKLAFGDRPKEITYKRLFALPSLQQLDEAFADEVARQYLDILGDGGASEAALCAVDAVLMREREAVMCHVAAAAAREAAAGGGGGVALVVGSAHLPGIRSLWDSGEWRALVAADDLKASPLMAAPPLSASDMDRPGAGARRGMLDAVLSLSVTDDVLADLDAHLPAVPEGQEEERALAYEFYSAQRVRLSALPRPLLDRVVSAAPGAAGGGGGKGGSFWEALAPLRAARPGAGNGGVPAWDEELIMELRALDMYISAGGGGEEEGDALNNAAGMA